MEKVLRKVKCDITPDDRTKTVLCEHWDGIKELGYFGGSFWYNLDNDNITPEYWYEEVDLKQAFEEAYKIQFVDVKAKERYEKAVKLANELVKQDFMDGFYFIAGEDIPHILKVAAGLQEE